jgi:hypothetical protein
MQPVSEAASPDYAESAATSARLLYECYLELGERQSNAVLEVLRGVETLEEQRRYPEGLLPFGNAHWRGYYHCHDAPQRPDEEHGHFHLFTRVPGSTNDSTEDWAHVAGLSVDAMGQPLQWFTVNRWVTGGPWVDHSALAQTLAHLPVLAPLTLTERWLAAMLGMYRRQLEELLQTRDRVLQNLQNERDGQNLLEDRGIYLLSTEPVDVTSRLQQLLDLSIS